MKTSIDIEELLVWAYRDMQIDKWAERQNFGVALRLQSTWGAVDHLGRYGTFIERSTYEPEVGDVDDAALIHRAVLMLDDAFLASAGDGGDIMVWDRNLIAESGSALEQRGERWAIVAPDGALSRVEQIVISVYLVLHARQATRPDCYADVVRRRGRPRKDGVMADGVSFPDVMFHRAVYSVWHAALGILAADLAGKLTRWEPVAPKAAESPWLDRPARVLEAKNTKNDLGDKPMKRRRKIRA